MKLTKMKWIVCSLILMAFMATAAGAAEPVKPTGKERCAVCGMMPTMFPEWITQIVFSDGTYVLFDGPKDMLKYYFHMATYTKGKTRADIADIFVTEYYSTELVNADEVFFITGSKVFGPMGMELVPVKGDKAAHDFSKDHHGKKMLTFDQITPADVPGLMKMHHMEGESQETEEHHDRDEHHSMSNGHHM